MPGVATGRSSRPQRRRRPFIVTGALSAMLLASAAGCGGGITGDQGSIARDYGLSGPQGTVRLAVGSKNFTEQQILGAITVQALQAAGAEVIDKTDLGDTEQVRLALISGGVDLYWEYTGTGWLVHLAEPESISDPQELYDAVSKEDLQQNGIAWLPPSSANNTYALAVRGEAADELGVEAISDLKSLIEERPQDATLCVGDEFNSRADGLPGLQRHYGFEFPDDKVFQISPGTVYGAVERGETCTFGSVYATNGRIPELGLQLLEDDESFFASYNPSVTVREATLDRFPELEGLFGAIAAQLDTETLRRLSASVEVDGQDPGRVAERWLSENGFTG